MKFYTNIALVGNHLLLRGYDNGQAIKKKIEYRPYLFVPDKTGDHKTLNGSPVRKLEFESISDGRNYYNYTVNMDSRLERIHESSKLQNKYGRFPSPIDGKQQIYGLQNFHYLYLLEKYKNIKYDVSKIRVGIIDIETSTEGGYPDIDEANREITAITIRRKDLIVALGCGDFDPPAELNVKYIKCKNEDQLLYKFLEIWEAMQLDVVTGWNIDFFDIPYIINRITRQLGMDQAKRLSPWRVLEKKNVVLFNKEHTVYTPVGISAIDYLQAYRKFGFTSQESYKLDHVAFMELGERKLDYSQYESLGKLYKENFQLYMEYNVKDVNLVYRLDEKLKLLELIYAMAYDALVNYADTFGTVRMWDVIIHNYLIGQGIVIPYNDVHGRRDIDNSVPGGYVKDPQLGMHEDVASVDLTSSYPCQIMQYNLSPETMIGLLEDPPSMEAILDGAFYKNTIREVMLNNDATISANGVVFRRDIQGFLAALMERMFKDRATYKKKMLDAKKKYEKSHSSEDENLIAQFNNLQMAKKIQLNSGFGAFANLYFRFYDPKMAEAITTCGQLAIRWAEKRVNEVMNKKLGTSGIDYIIAVDTDSMYIKLTGLIPKDLTGNARITCIDEICQKVIQPVLDQAFIDLASYVNARQQKMVMKREAIANKAIWTAKKRYIMNVYDLEGVRYEEPKMKIMGSEAIRTSTPTSVREQLKKTFALIMNTDEKTVQKEIERFRKEFKTLPFEDIAYPRGCNGLAKWTDTNGEHKKSTPIHVKGAIMYNKLLRDRNLDQTLTPVMDGDKIKFIYMKLPNPLHVGVLSVPGNLPRQLNLEQFIDYDTQFDKAFLEPISNLLRKIGWRAEEINTLDQFFI